MLVYNDKIRRYFDNPVNIGVIAPGKSVGSGSAGIPGRSSVVKISLQVNDKGVITDAKFKTYGCGVAIAASSFATEKLIHKTTADAATISFKDIIEYFHLEPIKYHCANLVEDAIKAALKDLQHNLQNQIVEA